MSQSNQYIEDIFKKPTSKMINPKSKNGGKVKYIYIILIIVTTRLMALPRDNKIISLNIKGSIDYPSKKCGYFEVNIK